MIISFLSFLLTTKSYVSAVFLLAFASMLLFSLIRGSFYR